MELGDNEAHIFQVPIPEELSNVGEDYDILVEVTLSDAANPRRTRRYVKGYLVNMVRLVLQSDGREYGNICSSYL